MSERLSLKMLRKAVKHLKPVENFEVILPTQCAEDVYEMRGFVSPEQYELGGKCKFWGEVGRCQNFRFVLHDQSRAPVYRGIVFGDAEASIFDVLPSEKAAIAS